MKELFTNLKSLVHDSSIRNTFSGSCPFDQKTKIRIASKAVEIALMDEERDEKR